MMPTGITLDELLMLLDLEPLDGDKFRGRTPNHGRRHVFGGQVAAQAFIAATRSVPEAHAVHSLHCYFLRGGDPDAPILFEVDRIRDGRSFTTRRVVAIQHDKAIFELSGSFQAAEEGPEHQDRLPPDVPDPETLLSFEDRVAPYLGDLGPEPSDWNPRFQPIVSRPIHLPPFVVRGPRPTDSDRWIRSNGVLPDDPRLHTAVVVYASDGTLLDTVTLPHDIHYGEGRFQIASLDHVMWFHRPFRADDWLLYRQHSPSAAGARGFATGRIHTREGALAVTVVQEGLIRPLRRP